jgi:hypothetical protein
MIPCVQRAEYVRDYVIHIWFSDGMEGEIGFDGELDGEVFEPLRDISYFRQFRVDPELHTLIWPNDADFAPESLYEKVRILA